MEYIKEQTGVKDFTPIHDKSKFFLGWWARNDVQYTPTSLFVYGDNLVKSGRGGQAVIRDFNNTACIPTKKIPNFQAASYMTDGEYDMNMNAIVNSIIHVINESQKYEIVYFPRDGLGSGLAKLNITAPATYEMLNFLILECFGIKY